MWHLECSFQVLFFFSFKVRNMGWDSYQYSIIKNNLLKVVWSLIHACKSQAMKNKASADGRDLFLCACCLATGYRRGLLLIFGLRGSRLLSLPIKFPCCDSSLLSCLLSVQPGTVRGTTTRTGEAETMVCGNKGRSTPRCLYRAAMEMEENVCCVDWLKIQCMLGGFFLYWAV